MKKALIVILCAITLISCSGNKKKQQVKQPETPKQTFELVAEVPNLAHCESITYDAKREVLYVSIQADKKTPLDGSIAKISLDGKVLNADFITGLNDPKGITVVGDKLYAADITELVEIDLTTEKVIKKHTADAVFLNDVTADKDGNVYVSDMFTSSVYKLDTAGKFSNWFQSAEMENPNGLLVVGNDMYIGAWGNFDNEDPLSAPHGRFLKMDIATKQIEKVTNDPIGHLDGVQVFNNNEFLLSDWLAGVVFKTSKDGKNEIVLKSEKSIGDILYIADKKLLALPINLTNKAMIYKVNI
ncbi:hypothetical protein EYV94_04115 [Puteibacter caeruleilacunae]|nr:hypothetical protein EYV94_04115 [Puteibacter caeruleilacunae]